MLATHRSGLISAAKAVGLGAKLLVDAADKVVLGKHIIYNTTRPDKHGRVVLVLVLVHYMSHFLREPIFSVRIHIP